MIIANAILLQGRSTENFGLLSDLLDQSGNRSSDIKIKVCPISPSQGDWSSYVAYQANEIRTFPSGSELYWKTNQSTSAGESPYTHPEKWDIQMGLDFIQNVGGGKYSRVTLQKNVDDWVRLNSFEIGTYANASFVNRNSNYLSEDAILSADTVTSIAVPTSHPSSRTLTLNSTITVSDSTSIGTCSDEFAMPTTRAQEVTTNLPSGLGLSSGDHVTLYGDANNFFILGIITYNNSTGATFGFCINSLGSGTFSSWDIRTEELVQIFHTASPTARNFQALVQSYNSGTGELIVKSINHGASASAQVGFTVRRNKSPNGVSATQSEFFTSTASTAEMIGSFFKGEFTGTKLRLNTQGNTTGTGWKVYYTGGPDIDNPPSPVTIDTYNGSHVVSVFHDVFEGLTEGDHTFVAVSVTSPSGSSANTRAFIRAGTNAGTAQGILEEIEYDKFTADFVISLAGSQSLGETVFIFAPTDADPVVTWPYHGDITDNNTLKEFFVDGVEVQPVSDPSINIYLRRYQSFTSAYVEQAGTIIHPAFPELGNFASYESTHRFDKNGFHLSKLLITLLQNQFVGQMYANLFAFLDSFTDGANIEAQDGETMAWPASGVTTNMTSTFKGQASYLFRSVNTDANRDDYVLGLFWPDVSNWRIGEAGRGTDHIENLGGASSKFRPYIVFAQNLLNGWSINIKARWYLGNKGDL